MRFLTCIFFRFFPLKPFLGSLPLLLGLAWKEEGQVLLRRASRCLAGTTPVLAYLTRGPGRFLGAPHIQSLLT